ncbi:MAG: HsdR family type I site-specific deoxyribonuclease, partial [Nitrospirota bacterium]
MVLYVNGIPLVNIECKNPASFSEDWTNAYNDIKAYEEAIPELYKYIQIGAAIAETARYFPIVSWQKEDIRTEEWKTDDTKNPLDALLQMLSGETLLDIIRNFIFYRIEFGKATKVITRYMQYRAVNRIFRRVIDNLEGREIKKKGLIWHWQGSGKTLEMIFAAYKLYHHRILENPSVFLIVDRTELEEQLGREFNALDITKPDVISSIHGLRQVLKHDGYKGKRGIMITLIHKFRPEELAEVDGEMKNLSLTQETLTTRRNVIAFVDEGHRTQYGDLAAQMKSILGEDTTFFFAFTGTPISKPERGVDTYTEFSYPPEETYLDKYFITESWKDGFTERIAYQPALADREGVTLKKDMLDAFLKEKYQEIPDNIRSSVEEGIREKLNIIKIYLENPDRIEITARHIAEHFKKNLDGKFKALITAVSKDACVTYKRALDKLLPPEYTEVIMSYDDKGDSTAIKKFKQELIKRHKGKDVHDIKRDVVDNFKEEEYPKLLIVKDMLLTGFDSPILQTLYLDQPLKEHRLLQAIARTNRPYKGIKEAGLIVDYIGILKDFHKAFEIYSREEIKGVLHSIEELKEDFIDRIQGIREVFKDIPKDKHDRGTLLKAIEVLTSDDVLSKKFLQDYKELRRLFEMLGSDVIKAHMAEEYGWISQIYAHYTKSVLSKKGEEKLYIEKYFKKTVEFIHKTTELKQLDDALPVIEFNEHYIHALEEKVRSKEERAANLVFTLNRFVLVDRNKNTIYESVCGRVEKLLKLWKQRTKNFEEIYKEGLAIWDELMSISERQKQLGLDDIPYNFLLILESELGKENDFIEDVKELYDLLDEQISLKSRKFPNWSAQTTVRKNVEKTIRKYVRRYVREHGIRLEEMERIFSRLLDCVIKNA